MKVRQAPAGFPVCEEIEQLEKLVGVIRCENPNRHLYEFNGNVQLERGHETIVTPISADAVLLRGSKLENTDWIFGFVIYTGSDSKLMMVSAVIGRAPEFPNSMRCSWSQLTVLLDRIRRRRS